VCLGLDLCSSAKVKEGFNAVHPFFSSSPIFHSPKAKMAAADNEEIPDVEKVSESLEPS
jgi:hypothetical protein